MIVQNHPPLADTSYPRNGNADQDGDGKGDFEGGQRNGLWQEERMPGLWKRGTGGETNRSWELFPGWCSLSRRLRSWFAVGFLLGYLEFGLGENYPGKGRNGLGQPNVAANDGTFTDDGISQNGGAGIDYDSIFDGGMPFSPSNQISLLIPGKVQSAESDPLVDRDALPDDRGFPDHHTGAVIDEKAFPDLSPGMDVDSGSVMHPLIHNAWNKDQALMVEEVGEAMDRNGLQSGIAENDFVEAGSGGIIFEGRFNVEFEHVPNFGNIAQKRFRDEVGVLVAVFAGVAGKLAGMLSFTEGLGFQAFVNFGHAVGDLHINGVK